MCLKKEICLCVRIPDRCQIHCPTHVLCQQRVQFVFVVTDRQIIVFSRATQNLATSHVMTQKVRLLGGKADMQDGWHVVIGIEVLGDHSHRFVFDVEE